ncbi:MAG: hypothetical protein ACOCQR_02680 [bacterium]
MNLDVEKFVTEDYLYNRNIPYIEEKNKNVSLSIAIINEDFKLLTRGNGIIPIFIESGKNLLNLLALQRIKPEYKNQNQKVTDNEEATLVMQVKFDTVLNVLENGMYQLVVQSNEQEEKFEDKELKHVFRLFGRYVCEYVYKQKNIIVKL